MSQSISDLHNWLDDLSDELYTLRVLNSQGKQVPLPFLCVEIFNDKTWRISEHVQGDGNSSIILESENMDNPHHEIDVYDLLRIHPEIIAKKIMEDQSVADIDPMEL